MNPQKHPARQKILLSEGCSTSARQTLYGLGDRYITDIMDPSPICQCRFSRLVRSWHRCPPFSKDPQGYLDVLKSLIRCHRYDVLFPTQEQVFLLSRFRDTLSRRVGLAVPEFESLRRLQSKAEFVRVMRELNLPLPETIILGSTDESHRVRNFPCYVKTAHSTAGTGVRLVNSREELKQALERFTEAGLLKDDTEIVVQEPVEGVMSVVQAVFQHGQLMGIHCAEALKLGIGGGLMARVGASHPLVVEHLRRLGRHLDWHGAMFIEYIYDKEAEVPRYIEANPRIGETVNAMLSGVNLCEMMVKVSLGEKLSPQPPGRAGVRSNMNFLALMGAAMDGANRRDLLKELWRKWTRQGYYRDSQSEITRLKDDPASIIPAYAVTWQLLALPSSVRFIVNKTVENYCLSEAASKAICEMPVGPRDLRPSEKNESSLATTATG